MRTEFKAAAVLIAILTAACSSSGIDFTRAPPAPKPSGFIKTSDGVQISYELKGQSVNGAPTLVFIHCWACDRSYWRYQVAEFSRDHQVLSFDLPGFGASGKNRSGWTIDGLGGDVAELVDGLRLDDVVLIGHSMGGPVALTAARRLQGRVRGVVCADTLHNADVAPTREMVEPLAASFEKDFPGTMRQMVQAMFPPGSHPRLPDEITSKASAVEHAPALALMRDFPNYDAKVALSAVGAPIRCINAAPRPPLAPETNVDGNRQYADFDAILMPDVGHYLMLERPQEFNENLRFILRDFPNPAR